MENHHIVKESLSKTQKAAINSITARVRMDLNKDQCEDDVMNSEIKAEVELTFNSSKGAAGPDFIHSNLIDEADIEGMTACLL